MKSIKFLERNSEFIHNTFSDTENEFVYIEDAIIACKIQELETLQAKLSESVAARRIEELLRELKNIKEVKE